MSIIIGKDDPDDLYLYIFYTSFEYDENTKINFVNDFKTSRIIPSYYADSFFLNGKHNINSETFLKDKTYNLEDSIKHFIENHRDSKMPIIFILKNNKWYYLLKPDWLMIPL